VRRSAMRASVLPFLLAALLLVTIAPLADGAAADASTGKQAKSNKYETKQSLKKEKKKKRREEKAELREKTVKAMKKKKAAVIKKKKGLEMSDELMAVAEEKMSWLRRAVDGSNSKIISLTPGSYREYVNDGPRLHWSFVVLTARGGGYRCPMCRQVHPDVLQIAKSLNYTKDQPTFVLEVDISRNQEIFNEMALTIAPVFLMIPPTPSDRKPKVKTLYKKLPDKYRLSMHSNIGVDDLKKFIERHGKQEINLIEELDISALFGWIIILGGISAFLYYKGDKLHHMREYKLPYFGVSIIAYIWLMGGGMYNIIRGTPFSGNGGGLMAFIHPSNGNQYGAGGLIVGGLNFGVGAMIILMNTWALRTPSPDAPTKRKRNEFKTPLQRLKELKPNPGLCLAGATVLWYNLVMIYSIKNPSYRLGFVQP